MIEQAEEDKVGFNEGVIEQADEDKAEFTEGVVIEQAEGNKVNTSLLIK